MPRSSEALSIIAHRDALAQTHPRCRQDHATATRDLVQLLGVQNAFVCHQSLRAEVIGRLSATQDRFRHEIGTGVASCEQSLHSLQ